MPPLEVAYLVGEDREQLGRSELLDERVEEGHPLVPSETGEEGIGLGRATRSVDQEDVPQGKIDRARVGENRVPQLTGGEGRESVEERHYPGRRDELDADRDERAHEPTPEPRLAPGPLEEPEDAREERAAQEGGEPEPLHEIRPERLGRRPVEAEALLDDERRPPAGGDRQDRAGEAEKGDEAEARRDRSEAETAHLAIEPTEAAGEPEGEQ